MEINLEVVFKFNKVPYVIRLCFYAKNTILRICSKSCVENSAGVFPFMISFSLFFFVGLHFDKGTKFMKLQLAFILEDKHNLQN